VTPQPPTSVTVTAGSPASYTVVVALRTGRRRLAFAVPFGGLILLVLYQAIGCGGGGGGGGGAPAGTYTITVAGNGGGSTSNATVTLIVN